MPGARDPKDVAQEVLIIIERFETEDVVREADAKTEGELREDPPPGRDAATWRPGQ
jgi:hypothetical protein